MIGVVGGVGPEASNKFCELLIKYKSAKKDQDHISFIHFCNPKIPDRTECILGKGEDPIEEIIKTCNILENSGANFLVIPCNTAHYFLPNIQKSVNIPIIDMTKVLIKTVLLESPPITKVGILATTGSIEAGIYQDYFSSVGVESIIPSIEDQENLVMRAIYGSSGIKAGKKILAKNLLKKASQKLIAEGCEAIILGCTEIPLVLNQKDFSVKLYDPMKIVAKEIIKYIEGEEKTEFITVKYCLKRPPLKKVNNII